MEPPPIIHPPAARARGAPAPRPPPLPPRGPRTAPSPRQRRSGDRRQPISRQPAHVPRGGEARAPGGGGGKEGGDARPRRRAGPAAASGPQGPAGAAGLSAGRGPRLPVIPRLPGCFAAGRGCCLVPRGRPALGPAALVMRVMALRSARGCSALRPRAVVEGTGQPPLQPGRR